MNIKEKVKDLSEYAKSIGVETKQVDKVLAEEDEINLVNRLKLAKSILDDAKQVPGAAKQIRNEM